MKIQIDIKSALFGIIVGVLAMFAIGAGTSPNEVGRYQISSGQNFIAIIDTKTGERGHDNTTTGEGGKDGNFWNTK